MMTNEDFIFHNGDAFRQIENEYQREFTHDQKVSIARLALDGMDFYDAFYRVTSLTAEITPAEQAHHHDFIRFRTFDDEYLEQDWGDGVIDGVYVTPSDDKESYAQVAEQWLAGVDGIWTITAWA